MIKCKHKALGLVIVFIAAVMFCLTPLAASAADAGTVELKASGSEALLIMDFPQAAAEEIASMQISLKVSTTSGANVDFIFDSGLPANITEAFYHSDTGELNIYIAGTTALFPKNSALTVGKVRISSSSASATVNVVEGSIQFVRGGELISPSDVSYPQSVTISTSSSSSPSAGSTPEQSTPNPSVPNEPDNAGPVDKSSLLSALSRAESYNRSDYTESSYNALVEAMNAAQTVLSNNYATQNDIDEALLELENSLAMLVLKNEAPTENDNSSSGDSSSGSDKVNNNSSTSGNDNSDGSDPSNSAASSENSQNAPTENKSGNDAVIWIIVAIMAALIAAFVTILIVLKCKNRK